MNFKARSFWCGLAGIFVCAVASAQAPQSESPQVQRGHEVFDTWCTYCHTRASEKFPTPPGTGALNKRYQGAKPAALEDRTDLPAVLVLTVVRNGLNSMPPFRKTEVSDAELQAVAAYLSRNSH